MKTMSALGVAALSVATLSGCSALFGGEAQQFAIGECLTYPEVTEAETEVNELPVVDCSEPHDAEVFALADSALEAFDKDALFTEAEGYCYGQFESYVGLPYEESVIYFTTLVPSSDGWDAGDRALICLLVSDVNGDNTGSLKDAGI